MMCAVKIAYCCIALKPFKYFKFSATKKPTFFAHVLIWKTNNVHAIEIYGDFVRRDEKKRETKCKQKRAVYICLCGACLKHPRTHRSETRLFEM